MIQQLWRVMSHLLQQQHNIWTLKLAEGKLINLTTSYLWQFKTKFSICFSSWKPRLPYNKERYTILKSAFVHKKHRVQYEVRTYFHFIHFHRLTGSTLSTFLEYIERNLPEGIALKATKVEMLALPEHMQQPPEPVESKQTQ